MKIEFFGESPADQDALAVFVEGILGEPPERKMPLEANGVDRVMSTVGNVIKALHYTTDAEGLVVVVDSDHTQFHESTHDAVASARDDCRLCKIREIVTRAKRSLTPRPGRLELRVAIGLAIPAIEAWYLVGKDHQMSEAFFRIELQEGRKHPTTRPYKLKLKKTVYGTEHPSIERETEIAVKEARRIIQDVGVVESAFPAGFGLMAQEIRSWKSK